MDQPTKPPDSGGVIAVPPELQQAFDEAVVATRGATSGGPTDRVLARDAFVAGWQAITRHKAFSSAPEVFRAYVFNHGGLGASASGRARRHRPAVAAFEAAVATVPNDSASRPGYLGSLGYALVARFSQHRDDSPIATP